MRPEALIGLAVLGGARLYWYKSQRKGSRPDITTLTGRQLPPPPGRRHTEPVPASGTVPGGPAAPSGPAGPSGDKIPAGEPVPPEWLPPELLPMWAQVVSNWQSFPGDLQELYEVSLVQYAEALPTGSAQELWMAAITLSAQAEVLGVPGPQPPPVPMPPMPESGAISFSAPVQAASEGKEVTSANAAISDQQAKELAIAWAHANFPGSNWKIFFPSKQTKVYDYSRLTVGGTIYGPEVMPVRRVQLTGGGFKTVFVTPSGQVIDASGGFTGSGKREIKAKKNPAGAMSVGVLVLLGLGAAYIAMGEKE